MADGGALAVDAFAALPHALVLHVLSLLPVDTRLRCVEVCRGWRVALESLWARLDLSENCGVPAARLEAADGLLAAAALRAGGQLHSLDVTGCIGLECAALIRLVGDSGATLRELRVAEGFTPARELVQLLRAAPHLRLLHAAGLYCGARTNGLLLEEALFAPLRFRRLEVGALFADEDMLALTLRLAATAGATALYLSHVDLSTAAALGAVVDAALALQMTEISFEKCELSATAAPLLARLVRGCALTKLMLCGNFDEVEELWGDEADALLLSDALRTNTSLAELEMSSFETWAIPAAGTALVGALTGHPSLRKLEFHGNDAVDAPSRAAASAALGALVAADTLTCLDVSYSLLGDVGLQPLVDALPGLTRLRTLTCYGGGEAFLVGEDELSEAFIRDRLLPAVRANASLRELALVGEDKMWNVVREVEELVNSRADD
jgi:hypothetical protein